MVFARVYPKIVVLSYQIIMSNEEDVADNEDHFTDDDEDELWLDQRELILLVKSNPALYAKSTKEYCKGFDKDLAWQRIGACLTKPLSGPEASKLFYNLRQRFGRERRKVADSVKGKSGQGAMAQYVPTWPLYEDCLFLADHIVTRRTSSSYKKPIQKAVIRSTGARRSSSPSPPVFRSTGARRSSSPSPSVFRTTGARRSSSPSPPVSRPHLSCPEASGSQSVWSNEMELFRNEYDTSDSLSATGRSHIAEEEEALVSPDVSQSSPSNLAVAMKAVREVGKSKRTVPEPDNFAVKKKRDDDSLSQAVIDQTNMLFTMTAKLSESINPNSILNAISIDKVILQGVPVERHLECIMELLAIVTNKYVKDRQK